MPGRGALLDIAAAKSDIRSVRMWENDTGVAGSDTSEIGNDGRKGASGHGMLDDPMYTRIDANILSNPRPGLATTGEQGIGADGTQANWKETSNAQGITFKTPGSKRKED